MDPIFAILIFETFQYTLKYFQKKKLFFKKRPHDQLNFEKTGKWFRLARNGIG